MQPLNQERPNRKRHGFFRRLWLKHFLYGVPLTTAIALTVLTIFLSAFNYTPTQKILFCFSVILCAIAYAMFLFSLYVICCRKIDRFQKAIAIIFLIYAAIAIIGGIAVLITRKDLIASAEEMIADPEIPDSSKHRLEDIYKCCCTQSCSEENPSTVKCIEVIANYLNSLTKNGLIGTLIVGLLLILTGGVLLYELREMTENQEVNFEEPNNPGSYQPIE